MRSPAPQKKKRIEQVEKRGGRALLFGYNFFKRKDETSASLVGEPVRPSPILRITPVKEGEKKLKEALPWERALKLASLPE